LNPWWTQHGRFNYHAPMDHLSLAGEFPPATDADWRAIVDKALVNAPFDALRTPLYEGFKTEPLYTKRDLTSPLHGTRGWHIIQPLTGGTLAETQAQLADDLANGTGALSIDFDAGLCVQTSEELKDLLGSGVSYFVVAGAAVADAALVLAAIGDGRPPDRIGGSAGFDPLTAFAISGEIPADRSALFADYADAAFHIQQHAPSFVPFLPSGEAWNGAGASATQELACTLAAGVAYWRALTEAGMPISKSARCIGFALTAAADIFLTVATFRAMRLLWGRALTAAGEKPEPDFLLVAKMSRRILSAYDPQVNLLRGTAAAFGAAIGGATGIEVLPFDEAAGGATLFSRRLARNTSLVLRHEAQLATVADAAAGSAYIETLTHELASAAWSQFREIEAKGGLAAALESGFVQDELRRTAEERERAIAHRKDKITGVSVFPDLSEKAPWPERAPKPAAGKVQPHAPEVALPAPAKGERFAALVAAARGGASLGDLRSASRTVSGIAAAPIDAPRRDAGPFEILRRRADIALATIGSRPPVFLAILGRPSDYRARANWVQGFFAAGGIEVIAPERTFDNTEALAAAFKQSPAPVACLCSSNAVYESMPEAASSLKKAGALFVYVAGPASVLKALGPAGAIAVDRLIHEGCNVLALLQEAQGILCVEELSEAAGREAREAGFEPAGAEGQSY
jgi:methylmalonyl-CoA mutase